MRKNKYPPLHDVAIDWAVWYTFYEKESADGTDPPEFVGRSYSRLEAKEFLKELEKAGPYTNGYCLATLKRKQVKLYSTKDLSELSKTII